MLCAGWQLTIITVKCNDSDKTKEEEATSGPLELLPAEEE